MVSFVNSQRRLACQVSGDDTSKENEKDAPVLTKDSKQKGKLIEKEEIKRG